MGEVVGVLDAEREHETLARDVIDPVGEIELVANELKERDAVAVTVLVWEIEFTGVAVCTPVTESVDE